MPTFFANTLALIRRLRGVGVPVAVASCLAITLTSCASNSEPPSTEELVRESKAKTVLVKALKDGKVTGTGSGWVVDSELGYIATNFHVLAAGNSFEVSLEDDIVPPRSARIRAAAPCEDIALLQVGRIRGLESFELSEPKEIAAGQKVVTLGFPKSASDKDELQVTEGIISQSNTELNGGRGKGRNWSSYPSLVQLDAALNPGNSGGPSIDEDGDLVGMNTFIGRPGQGYAISSQRLARIIPQLEQGKSRGWGGFGFSFIDEFLIVESVVPRTGAADANLFVFDSIFEARGKVIDNSQDYCDAVGKVSDETVEVSGYELDGGPFTIDIKFE